MNRPIIALLASLFLIAGCGQPAMEEDPDAEGCEHMQEGPAKIVTAATTPTAAPTINDPHTRYDVTLVDVTGGKGGSVSFNHGKAGDLLVFLSADVPFKVTDASNVTVAIHSSATSVAACTDVKGRHLIEAGVGMFTFTFGPATATSVNVVVESLEGHTD